MIKKVFGNLWVWVVAAFVIVITAWVLTIRVAGKYNYKPVSEDENLTRQLPEPTSLQPHS